MSSKLVGDPKASITEKQAKLLYWISKLEQLIDEAVHTLVEEINSQEIPAYQEKTEKESNTLQTEKETETINNLTTNPISEKKLPEILKEI